jgi:hypothetical protein
MALAWMIETAEATLILPMKILQSATAGFGCGGSFGRLYLLCLPFCWLW